MTEPAGNWALQHLLVDDLVRVLVVDDEPADQALVGATLQELASEQRMEIILVSTLSDAVAHLDGEHRIDVVTLDLALPDAQGEASLKGLIDAAPEVPIVVLTSTDDPVVAVKMMKLGADDFVVKSADPGLVAYTVFRSIANRRQIRHRIETVSRHARQVAEIAAIGGVAKLLEEPDLLRSRDPEAFAGFVSRYEVAVVQSLRARTNGTTMSAKVVADLASEMVASDASGRDVIAVHAEALRRVSLRATPDVLERWLVEGRLMVLQLATELGAAWRAAAIVQSLKPAESNPSD